MGARHPRRFASRGMVAAPLTSRSRPALGETLPLPLGTSLSPSSWSPTYRNLLTGDYLSYSPHPSKLTNRCRLGGSRASYPSNRTCRCRRTRKCDGLTVEDPNEPRIAALVGDSGSTLVIYGRQKEHVTAFDERLVLSRNLCQHHARLNVVSKPPRVEAVLQ
jgi:hypothetical protein